MYGQGAQFNPSNKDYIDIGNFTAFHTAGFTISAWVYTKDQSNYHGAVVQRDSNNDGVWLGTDADSNDIFFDIDDSGGTGHQLIPSTGNFTTGTWHHLVASYDGSEMRAYLNSGLEGTNSVSINPIDVTEPTYIGANQTQSQEYWDGKIDDVRIYNTALTPLQVEKLYHKGAYRIPRESTLQ